MISVIIPTRNRIENLKRVINSLKHNANSPDNYEILLGIDNDDTNIYEFDGNVKIINFERLGYLQFHKYTTKLVIESKGQLIWSLPDDCEILTKNHNEFIEKNSLLKNIDKLYLKPKMTCGYNDWKFSIIPVFNKKWLEITGRISENSQTDLWLGHIADDLNIVHDVDILCNLFEPSNGLQHDSVNFYTRDKDEWEIDKEKIKKYLDENKLN